MEDVTVTNAGGDQASADGDMVQYVIYSGDGDQPIALEELRDALTKLTGQPVSLQSQGRKDDDLGPVAHPALSHDTDLNFRLSAERMVGEVSFVDDNIVENGQRDAISSKIHDTPSKLVIDDSNVTELLKRQEKPQIPSQITIETEYGPITLDTSKLTQGQLEGTEQITVNLLTTDASGDASKAVTETRGLKLPPGLLAPKKALYTEAEESIQGHDFSSVLQQLTDLCSEQNPLPVQENEKALLKDAEGLEDFMNLKIPHEQKQSGVIEVDKLETFLKSKFGDSAKIQIHPTGVIVHQAPKTVMKPVICCAAHSELKNQETRRCMLPIPLDVTKCPECSKECMNRKNLRLHIQRFHVPDFKHQCQTRARVVPPPPEDIITDIPILVENAEALAEIGEKSLPKEYRCSVCDQQFSTQKEYFNHIEVHGQRNMVCALCGMKYSRVSALKNHVNVVHGGSLHYQCKYCMQAFNSSAAWSQHESEHETATDGVIECLKCHDLVPRAKLRQHMASLHRVVYKPKLDCIFCGSRFKSPEYLAAHTQQFHNFEKYDHLCDLCYKAFPAANERDLHIIRAHTDEEMMEAEVEFSWHPRDCFKRQCPRCGSMFQSYSKLKAHYDKHEEEKSCCLLCGGEFRWIVNLDLHYKRDHSHADLVKFGVITPTMNLVRHDNGDFELVPKVGRQYYSRFDLADLEPSDESEAGKIVVMEYTTVEGDSNQTRRTSKPSSYNAQARVIVRQPPKSNKINQPGPSPKVQGKPLSARLAKTKLGMDNRPTYQFTEEEYNKVLGKSDFDYRKYLPTIESGDDLANVKAPRHNDIVIGRPATVINLARVWSRRERGLFYMGNEADKFRRAAATIPKKRIGDKWVEMPLFVDELSGKLVTVEGMAELWRERAQMFLDHLGRGQIISDFLPVYELGQKTKGGKPLAKQVETSVQRSETMIRIVEEQVPASSDKIEKTAEKKADVSQPIKSKTVVKDEILADGKSEDKKEKQEYIDETMFTRKIMVVNEDGSMQEAEKTPREQRKRVRKEPEKDIIPDIVKGIKKAKRELKARATATASVPRKDRRSMEKPRIGVIKGRKGRPPGLNPDRDSPFSTKPRLILSDINEIIGDAKKIIVQVETDHSPERRYWKKQTARKSFVTRRQPPESSLSSSESKTRQSRFEKRDDKRKDEEEKKRSSTRAQRDRSTGLDVVDGSNRKSIQHEKDKSKDEPQDKGAAPKTPRTAKTGEKRAGKNEANSGSPPAKKAKASTIISPRAATLTGSTRMKHEPESKTKTSKKTKESVETEAKTKIATKKTVKETVESETTKKTNVKNITSKKEKEREEEKPPSRGRGRPRKKIPSEEKEVEKNNDKSRKQAEDAENRDASPDPEMPTLEIEITSHEYIIPSDSPLPSTSSISDDISRETKRAMEFLPADFDLEEASLNTSKKTVKMILHDVEPNMIRNVGSALSPIKQELESAGDAWDVLVNTPTRTPSKKDS